jgi:hypothetical protein
MPWRVIATTTSRAGLKHDRFIHDMSKPTQECIVWNYRGVPLIYGGGCRGDVSIYQLSDYDNQSFCNSAFGDLTKPEPPNDEVVPDVLSDEFCVFTCIDCNEVFNAEFSLMRCVECMRGFVNPKCELFPQHVPIVDWEETIESTDDIYRHAVYETADNVHVESIGCAANGGGSATHSQDVDAFPCNSGVKAGLSFPDWHTIGRDLNGPQTPAQRSSDQAVRVAHEAELMFGLPDRRRPPTPRRETLLTKFVASCKKIRAPKMPALRWVMRAFHNWSAITSTDAEVALARHLINLRTNDSLTEMEAQPYRLAAGLAEEFRMKHPNPTRNRAMVRAAHDFFDEKILRLRTITRTDHVDALHIFAVLCFVPSESELRALAIFAAHPIQERIVEYNTPRSVWVKPSLRWWLGYYKSIRVVPPD